MNPADLTLNTSPLQNSKALPSPSSVPQKNGKIPVPRVELEPIYTQLKSALGDHWTEYKNAINAFVLGNLNQAELSWVLEPLLSSATSVLTSTNSTLSPISTLHLHNSLITGLFANTTRDPPPDAVAPWVVATDKPTTSKNANAGSGVNDKADERLKREVMSLHARDRRRLKNLKTDPASTAPTGGLAENLQYAQAVAVRTADSALQSPGGLVKTNTDLEIRRGYAQPIASETLEFPSHSDIQARIDPICYEEGLVGGAQGSLAGCAELLEQATEVFLKELLCSICSHSRSNGENTIATHRFKQQLHKEVDEVERGTLQRNPAGLLPVDLEVMAKREPLNMSDLQLALQLEDSCIKQDRFLDELILLDGYAEQQQEQTKQANGLRLTNGVTNGTGPNDTNKEDAMSVDEQDWGWNGGTKGETESLFGVLDDCLIVG